MHVGHWNNPEAHDPNLPLKPPPGCRGVMGDGWRLRVPGRNVLPVIHTFSTYYARGACHAMIRQFSLTKG